MHNYRFKTGINTTADRTFNPGGVAKTNLNNFNKLFYPENFRLKFLSGFYAFWSNKRFRWGLVFLLLFAPVAKFSYLLFPEKGFGEYFISLGDFKIANTIEGPHNDWFWGTIRMYLFANGELLAPVLTIFGLFLLFPKKYFPAYLAGVPFGYYLSMMTHRMFFVTSNENFDDGFTLYITLAFVILGIFLLVVSDSFFFRQSSQKHSIEARVLGIVKMPGISWQEKEALVSRELTVLDRIDNELFIKK